MQSNYAHGADARHSASRVDEAAPGLCEWKNRCHAICYRLDTAPPVNKLRATFSKLMMDLTRQSGDKRFLGADFFVDEIPCKAGSPMAERRRSVEMSRPARAPSGWRVLLLRYRCGIADLIVVAHHGLMDSVSLGWIAQLIIAGAEESLVRFSSLEHQLSLGSFPGVAAPARLPLSSLQTQLAWCINSALPEIQRGVVHVDVGNGTSTNSAILIAATALMAARYGGGLQTTLIVAKSERPELEPYTVGALECLIPVSVPCNEDLQTGEIIASVARALATPIAQSKLTLRETSMQASEGEPEASIGVFLANMPPNVSGATKPEEYLPVQGAIYPITLVLHSDSQRNVNLRCSYAGIGFDETILTQFTRSVARVYVELLGQGERSARSIETLSESEKAEVAAIGRSDGANASSHDTIHSAFETVAHRLPSRPALLLGQTQLSYRELDEYANRVARVLANRGVRKGQCVGVCVDRSCELVIILLAAMKAGATYVPMEPDYPSDRLAFIARDSGARLLVTCKAHFPVSDLLDVIDLAELMQLSASEASDPIDHLSPGENAAYIIYTSGSTGRPKGVAVPHRNILSLITATEEGFGLSCGDTWTFFHSAAFDFSVWEIWGCLLTGGRLVVVPYWVSRSPSDFLDLLKTEKVTVLNQTPSAFVQLMDADRRSPLDLALRLVIFGGEPLNSRTLLPWFDSHPESQCRLVNMFGITETTVHVTAETLSRHHALKALRSVGRPLPGWHLYVLDSAGRMVPPGVAGEIFVGGVGVALHYVNKADLTAERFVPDPHSCSRMYRTGDKGRLLPDGRLEHLGRLDNQVKVRGFRIELNEIQAALLDAPQVVAAAVVLHQDDPVDAATAHLDAYVVLAGGQIDEVRRHIARFLPEYMMPAYIVVLPALPLTGNGKFDVNCLPDAKALSMASLGKADDEAEEDDRQDDLPDQLRQIWEEVLKTPIGLDDNFFDLGGNSLYAVRIAGAVRERGLPRLPLRDIYVHQTIRRIARTLRLHAEQSTA